MSLFIFNKSEVQATSLKSGSAGTNVDLFAVPIDSLTSISASSGSVTLHFENANLNELIRGGTDTSHQYAQVDLTVKSGRELDVVKFIAVAISNYSKGKGSGIIMDDVADLFPGDYITGISAIKRFE
tara:strand:- start:794 stop:1174 length:381 start_codon:yes stop_codon:yes gene_type:complete